MSGITLVVEDQNWRSHRGLQAKLLRAADSARQSARLKGGFSILLADNKKLRALNRDFRGKDKATNVLSFPSQGDYRGDIAIAYGVTKKEAKTTGKTFADHATHLVVHGVLHLIGYDHMTDEDAERMEHLETAILASLAIADPYAASAAQELD